MALKTCECCGQVLPDQWELVAARARLSRKQTDMLLAVAKGNGRPVPWERIEHALYGHDPDGGPLGMRNTLYVTAYNVNKNIETFGYKIKPVGRIGLCLVTLSAPQ